ncbi:MAG TPA: DUF4157 domain-containing protein, partial [Terriglobales bacterium]|nr:DUF4157 domain-containing protein [Terriglobales bacterium]
MATLGLDHRKHPILHSQSTIGNQAVLRMLQTHAEEHDIGWTAAASSRFGHDFSRIPIHPPATGAIQTKLAINKPGDEYEQEADRVAEQVMRMPEPRLQRACACGGSCANCQEEESGQEPARLQMKRISGSDLGQTAAPPIVHEVLRSPGQPLEPSTRAFMEPRFRHDFGQVRVHSDGEAAESARAVNALAYTVGHDIVFGAAQYAPADRAGRRLLAHELAHLVQQESGRSPGLVQRAEVDDRSCAGLKDIEPDIDKEVNKEIDDARKAAGIPMNVMTLLKGVFQRLGVGVISPIEKFIEGLGSSKIKIPPHDLAGTKYQGVGAVNRFYKLQGTRLHVVAGAA